MGQLLSSLTPTPELGFDIERATPSGEERELYDELYATLIEPTKGYLDRLRSYTDPQIKESPISPELCDEAYRALVPIVEMLNEFYEYSKQLQVSLPRLLEKICMNNREQHHGLTRLFADVLDFVFEFDYIKMNKPAVLNNLSICGRIVQSSRLDQNEDAGRIKVQHDIPLFFGYATPMLNAVIDATTSYVKTKKLESNPSDFLARLWGTCYRTVNRKRSELQQHEPQTSEDTAFYLKVMVVCIILYDHIDPDGAFCKQSPINIKKSVKVIQATDSLANKDSTMYHYMFALQRKSKHLKDDSTPKSTRSLVMV